MGDGARACTCTSRWLASLGARSLVSSDSLSSFVRELPPVATKLNSPASTKLSLSLHTHTALKKLSSKLLSTLSTPFSALPPLHSLSSLFILLRPATRLGRGKLTPIPLCTQIGHRFDRFLTLVPLGHRFARFLTLVPLGHRDWQIPSPLPCTNRASLSSTHSSPRPVQGTRELVPPRKAIGGRKGRENPRVRGRCFPPRLHPSLRERDHTVLVRGRVPLMV